MAHIAKTKQGRYRALVVKLGVRASKTFDSKAQARDWGAQKEAEILQAEQERGARGFLSCPLGKVLDEYADRFSSKKRGGEKEAMRFEAFKRDFPWLAAKPMHETTTADWARWRDERLAKVKGSSVLRDINLFSAVYHKARKELGPYVGASPLTDMDKPKDSPAREAVWDWRLVKFVVRQLGYVTGRPPSDKGQEVAYAILVALRTSMRAQEVVSLSDENTDLVTRVAVVNHKMQYSTGAPRKVPMQPQAARLLRPLQEKARGGPWFTLSPSQLDGLWRKRRSKMLVEGVTFHDTRATAITRLARRVDVLTLSRISGIKDLRLLNERYYRERDADIAARL